MPFDDEKLDKKVDDLGLEPRTSGLRVRCATIALVIPGLNPNCSILSAHQLVDLTEKISAPSGNDSGAPTAHLSRPTRVLVKLPAFDPANRSS
jgi:hypothetical protein